jgi:cytochrome c biogenesis protein CcmG, thiol:disulfide interchange protein DsbE
VTALIPGDLCPGCPGDPDLGPERLPGTVSASGEECRQGQAYPQSKSHPGARRTIVGAAGGERDLILRPVRVRSLIPLLAVVALLALLVYGLASKGTPAVSIGETAPAGPLPRLSGAGSGSLADYRGRWVLVNFWASWCIPCRQEAPALERFQRARAGSSFTVLGIDSRDLSSDGQRFVRQYRLTYPQLRDGNGQRAHEFGSTGVPENFLIDPQGKLRLINRGPVDAQYLHTYVAPMLPGGKS